MRRPAKVNNLKLLKKHPVVPVSTSKYCECKNPELVGIESPRNGKELGMRWCKRCGKNKEVELKKEYIWLAPKKK
jgi:hypothetical protein